MDVRVILDKWGRYSKGEIIKDMPDSTAQACIDSKAVEEVKDKPAKEQKRLNKCT